MSNLVNLLPSLFANFKYRLGVIDMAHSHMTKASPECKKDVSAKIAKVKDHLIRCGKARKDDNWIAALREVDAMIAGGADSSQPVINSMEITKGIFFRFNPSFSDFISIISLKICLISDTGI